MALTKAPAELLNLDSSLTISGTTPSLTIGDAGAEDTKIVFDGNAQDFYIGLDDSADDLIIGLGSTVGTTPIISVDENKDVAIPDGSLTITTDDNTSQLTLKSTDADASAGPKLDLFRDSGSPADDDILGKIRFLGDNDSNSQLTYADIEARIVDASNGSEDGRIELSTVLAGSGSVSRIFMDATETIINNDSKDLDFRVESDGNANMLVVDAGNNRVAIGRSNPSVALTVDPDANVSTSFGSPLIQVGGDNSWGGNGSIFTLGFGYIDSAVPSKSPAELGFFTETNSGYTKGSLIFATRDATTDTAPSERMRIASDGKVGIGVTDGGGLPLHIKVASGDCKLRMETAAKDAFVMELDNSTGALKLGSAATAGAIVIEQDGQVGIGTAIPGGALQIDADSGSEDLFVLNNEKSGSDAGVIAQFKREGTGTGFISNTSSATSYATSQSDRRAKKNFEDWTESVLSHFKDLKPTKFHFTQEDDSSEKNKGYIAQDLVESFPEAYPLKNDGEDADRYFFNPGGMVVYLMKAIQEQQELIETLQTKVKALEET